MKLRFVCALALGVVIIAGGGLSSPDADKNKIANGDLAKVEHELIAEKESRLAKK